MPITIIAEIGLNHNGSLQRALYLVDAAKIAGANLVKFQTYRTEKLLHPSDPSYDRLKKLELPLSDFVKIAAHCEAVGIEFLSTPGDVECLEFLVKECGMKRVKIGSDDLTNKPLTKACAETRLPLIISTGMATAEEIREMLQWIFYPDIWSSLTLMHCVSLYPTPLEMANLSRMRELRRYFCSAVPMSFGYSDHTRTQVACTSAAALGARIIEAHLMIDEDCIDRSVSFSMPDFHDMVFAVRNVEKMLGNGVTVISEQEREQRLFLRKGPDGLRPIGKKGLYG